MSYRRVLPRDLFNEAQLLKCLGQLALLVNEGQVSKSLQVRMIQDMCGFNVHQHESDGSLYCLNCYLWHGDNRVIQLSLPYNSRRPYPLQYMDTFQQQHLDVFAGNGQLSGDFLWFIGELDAQRV